MEPRRIILAVALLSILGLGALTVDVLISEGLDILVAASLLVLAMFGFGIVGALLHRPDE